MHKTYSSGNGPRYDGGGSEPGGGGQAGLQMAMPPLTPVTKKLLILNLAIFALTFLLWLVSEEAVIGVFKAFGLRPGDWSAWFPLCPAWQLVSYGFLHSVQSPTHVLWNMVQLYFFGTMLEGLLGSRRFLVTYFAAMIAGAVCHLVLEAATGSAMPAIGASGAVLGVVVAAATLRPRARVFVFFIPVTMMLLAGVIVAIDLLSALRDLKMGGSDGTAHWVHLGGAAWGFLGVRFGWVQTDWVERFRARRAIAQEEARRTDELAMDQLLQKIHREGMTALSKRERDFLRKLSDRK